MLLLTSCFYWPLRIHIEDENHPPEILHSDPSEGAVLQVTTSSSDTVFVVVQDKDPDDELSFMWSISGLGLQSGGEPLLQDDFIGSKIVLNNIEVSWHNRTLTCKVYDSERTSAEISWTIEVLEEN